MATNNSINAECRYNLSDKDALKTAQNALEEIQKHGLNANPIHFALFYELLTDINPDIAEQVKHAIQFKSYDDNSARVLFNSLWSEIIRHNMPTEEFSDIINDLILVIETWVSKSQQGHESISANLEKLSKSEESEKILLQLQQEVIPNIKQHQDETRALQSQIQDTGKEIRRLKEELDKATAIAKTDELTNIPNRRGFNEIIHTTMEKANQDQSSFALLIVDIDHFKKINDTYGHLVGDSILRYMAKSLYNETKGKDSIARIGGEEFVVILPHTAYSSAISVAKSICQKIAKRPLKVKSGSTPIHMTVSIGVAMYQLDENVDTLFDRADKSLYLAKTTGRNRVCGETDL